CTVRSLRHSGRREHAKRLLGRDGAWSSAPPAAHGGRRTRGQRRKKRHQPERIVRRRRRRKRPSPGVTYRKEWSLTSAALRRLGQRAGSYGHLQWCGLTHPVARTHRIEKRVPNGRNDLHTVIARRYQPVELL